MSPHHVCHDTPPVAYVYLVRPMNVLIVFAIIYIPLMIVLGEIIHAQGRKLLQHAFGSGSAVAGAISVLLLHRLVYDSRRSATLEPRVGCRRFGQEIFLWSVPRD